MYASIPRPSGTVTAWWMLLAVLVLVMDGFLPGAHVLHHLGRVLYPDAEWLAWFRAGSLWNTWQDGSLGHLQLGAAAVLLLALAVRSRGYRVLAVWSGIFLAMLADDFLKVHEQVGRALCLTTMGAQELGGLLF